MLSFLHSADWQIGKPYARVEDPDKRAKLRQVRIEAIDRIGQCARDQQAAFLLVAGISSTHQPRAAATSAPSAKPSGD